MFEAHRRLANVEPLCSWSKHQIWASILSQIDQSMYLQSLSQVISLTPLSADPMTAAEPEIVMATDVLTNAILLLPSGASSNRGHYTPIRLCDQLASLPIYSTVTVLISLSNRLDLFSNWAISCFCLFKN